ncbi:MAG: tetratricopeptide repeat protein [Rhodocyclaceae bacterium]|nr:tetratricopeptide repeat protein [Rhodocyclaceae bacterium]
MSLINDMLRDLDSRNAASSERSGLAQNIRALPPQNQRRQPLLLLMLAAAALGGGAVWLLLKPDAAPPAETLPAATTVAVAPPPAEPAPTAAEATAEAVPAAPAAQPEVPVLRLDTQLDPRPASSPPRPVAPTVVPAPATTQAPTPAPAIATPPAPARAASPATSAPTLTPPAAAGRAVDSANRSNAPAQISKQPTQGSTPAEQAEADYRRGIAAIRRGDTSEAGEALRAALRLMPAHVAARQALLGQLTEQQRWHDAETLALDGVGLLPQRSDWALLAARLMYDRGEAELALETLNQHAAAARQNADYQVMHALLLQRAGRYADAANCYRTALALRPGEGRWWFGLGRALDADRREAEARQAYEKARDSGNLPPDLLQSVERRLR